MCEKISKMIVLKFRISLVINFLSGFVVKFILHKIAGALFIVLNFLKCV